MNSDLIDQTISLFRQNQTLDLSNEDKDLIKMQIEVLEGIRSSLLIYGSIRYQIQSFDKLMSDPWMENGGVFDRLYAAWTNFRGSFVREIEAMTVNERLCYMGLMEDFENATGRPSDMRAVLLSAFLSSSDIEAIIRRNEIR